MVVDESFDHGDLQGEYERRALGRLGDAAFALEVSRVLSVPRDERSDSFVLHSGLELAARTGLLGLVSPERREATRLRMLSIGSTYESGYEPVDRSPESEFAGAGAAVTALSAAIADRDLERADDAAAFLGSTCTSADLRRLLADVVVPSLAAAAHGSIFLYLMPRIAPRGELSGAMLRPLVRELTRDAGLELEWIDRAKIRLAATDQVPLESVPELFEAIALLEHSNPGHDFIFPVMHAVDSSGQAEDLLAAPLRSNDAASIAVTLLRAATWSMLEDDPDKSPYGWSHCLTLPQAALGVASAMTDPAIAVAAAATFVVGSRVAMTTGSISPYQVEPCPAVLDLAGAIHESPVTAATAAWHLATDDEWGVRSELASRAAVHRDAHLAKYTLACIDLADWDRVHARDHLAAAAHLSAWWAQLPDPTDQLAATSEW
jgi:hypothetical protein